LQLLKQQNAFVTAVCNSENFELIKSLGANRMIDFENEDFTHDEMNYDYVFDAVGKSSFSKCKKLLKSNGVYISSELGKNSENIWLSIWTHFFAKKKVVIPIPKDCKKTLNYVNI